MRAISSMATRHLLRDLFDAASASGLPSIELEAVGGVDAAARVAAGEQHDLVILADDTLRRLAADGHVDDASVQPLALSQVAVAVAEVGDSGGEVGDTGGESTAARPTGAAFADAEGLRAALLAADRIGYSTGPSGTALVRMIETWGLKDELGPRLRRARPGVPVAVLVARGEADIGLQQLSELVGQPGVRILGLLPEDSAIDTVFSGAVASTASDPAGAAAVLAFLASTATAPIKAAHSFLAL